jgi:hypothetical protein
VWLSLILARLIVPPAGRASRAGRSPLLTPPGGMWHTQPGQYPRGYGPIEISTGLEA